ncbi:TetR/AcrR family transcriptional regulator [Kitasatospora sp. NPDC054939]
MVRRRPPGRARRARILAVAADRFHRDGYHQVSMAEVAAGVGITAPALYRHFRGKSELLDRAVHQGLGALLDGLRTADGTAGAGAVLAAVAVEHRPLGTLVQRDARLLPPERRAAIRAELRAAVAAAAVPLRAERPELAEADVQLLCWSALSLCSGPSYRSALPQPRRAERLLRELVAAVFALCLDGEQPRLPDGGAEAAPQGRREELLAAAVRLFHERGFDNVSTGGLGAAVGISGPSVYRHFDSKAALLAAALDHGRERLVREVADVLAEPADPAAALADGLAAYVAFARRHRHYLGAMLSESERLAVPDRRVAIEFRRAFLRSWVDLLCRLHPGWDAADARLRVHALFAVVNDAVRNRAHRSRPDLDDRLLRLGRAVLGLGKPDTA